MSQPDESNQPGPEQDRIVVVTQDGMGVASSGGGSGGAEDEEHADDAAARVTTVASPARRREKRIENPPMEALRYQRSGPFPRAIFGRCNGRGGQ